MRQADRTSKEPNNIVAVVDRDRDSIVPAGKIKCSKCLTAFDEGIALRRQRQ
jgi:hypothetical protein